MIVDFSLMENDSERIEYLNSLGQYINNGTITPEKISEALANYFSASSWLTTILESVEKENGGMKIDYEIWKSEKFLESKNKLSEGMSKSLKLSQGEIEAQMISDNKEEYKEWQHKLLNLQRSEGFYRRLCQNFEKQGQMLINLSQMMRTEMFALSVENRADKDLVKECITNHVKVKKIVKVE